MKWRTSRGNRGEEKVYGGARDVMGHGARCHHHHRRPATAKIGSGGSHHQRALAIALVLRPRTRCDRRDVVAALTAAVVVVVVAVPPPAPAASIATPRLSHLVLRRRS